MGQTLHDFSNDTEPKVALKIQAITTNTTTVGEIIDRAGYEEPSFIAQTGTVTDGDYEVNLYAGDESDMSDEAEVTSANDYTGTIPAWVADTDDNKVEEFTYLGNKRYLRLKVVSLNTSSGAYLGAIAVLGKARHAPAGATQAP